MANRLMRKRLSPRACSAGNDGPSTKSNSWVMGVDPGLERTGYAVVEVPSGRLVDAGVIRTSPRSSLPRRLGEIDEGIEEVLTEHPVDHLIVEDLFAHYKHPRTAILMGHARGVILCAAERHHLDVLSISATKIKKALTGNGHAGKGQMQRAIMACYGLPRLPEPPDVADALAAAFYAVAAAGGRG